ncbi:MAG: hypothetical protein WBA97_08580 [Actinophytocola sp.]|uniref:hypothetical protein n=1 Tax=Actinophytocola sp. TaxID=1872138 RepID=UPI003C732C0E
MQNTTPQGAPTRFEVGVACAVAVPLGIAAFVLVGMATPMLTPFAGFGLLVLGPALLNVAAVGGGWLVARGGWPAKGLGLGLLTGWAVLAIWSSGMGVGLGVLG